MLLEDALLTSSSNNGRLGNAVETIRVESLLRSLLDRSSEKSLVRPQLATESRFGVSRQVFAVA